MKIIELQNELKTEMTERDFTNELIEKLTNDVNMLLYIEYQIDNGVAPNITKLFDVNGFHQLLENQYYEPTTFETLKKIDMNYQKSYENVVNDIDKFYEIGKQIVDKWNNLPFGYSCELSEGYPFDESFDEIVTKIGNWIEQQKFGEK